MLYLATDDSWTFSVTVTVGAFAPATYTNAATDNNARLASAAFLLWLNGGGRPWAGVVTWTLATSRSSTSGVRYTYACGNIFTLTGGAATCLGLAVGAYPGTVTSSADAAGSWWPSVSISVRGYACTVEAGDASGTGAVRPGSPGAGLYVPTVEAIGDGTDAARLSSILANSASPRVVQIYQLASTQWLTLSLGEVQRSRTGVDYRFTLACVGA